MMPGLVGKKKKRLAHVGALVGINGGWIHVLKVWFEVLQGKDSSLTPIHTV